jgi:D-sedoheptulose 7-phosphate isomerase
MKFDFNNFYKKKINESLSIKKKLKNSDLKKKILICVNKIYTSISSGGKILLCGNGGSAADAQHLAAEFLVRLRPHINRKSIPAISLAMDTSTITACANDYSFKYLFSRNLEALGSDQDILIVISTSGNSKNIFEVLKVAKKKKIFSIAFLGNDGGTVKNMADASIIIPSKITARIQECHIFLGHLIFEAVEDLLIKSS